MSKTPSLDRSFGIVDTTLGLAFILLLIVLPLVWIAPPIQWHDQQRLGQIVLGFLAIALLLRNQDGCPSLSRGATTVFVLVCGLGVVSSLLAHQTHWAFTEMAVFGLCFATMLSVAAVRQGRGDLPDHVLLYSLWFLAAALLAKFLVAYTAALTVQNIGFFPWDMISGFSNVRFQGHIVTMVLPLVLLPYLSNDRRPLFKWGAVFLVAGLWLTVIAVGTRGTWLGLGFASAIMFWLGGSARRLGVLIAASALAGWVLMIGLFDLVPHWVIGDSKLATTERALATLSERDVIWRIALDMITNRPLLGYGPMHFADVYNTVAAHPHQAFLQWASEWGLPSALLLGWTLVSAGVKTSSVLFRTRHSKEFVDLLRVAVATGVLASLVQSMVDGVIVMPYSQLCLSLMLGWLWALHPSKECLTAGGMRTSSPALLIGFVVAGSWLSYVAIRDYPIISDPNFMFNDIRDAGFPRFWLYGLIYQGS